LYGQFGAKFPEDYWKIAVCVVAYFLLSGVVTLIDWFIVRDANFLIRDNKSGEVFVGLKMKKGESHVTLRLRNETRDSEYKMDIDKLFDVEGTLLQTATLNAFNHHYTSFTKKESKKTN